MLVFPESSGSTQGSVCHKQSFKQQIFSPVYTPAFVELNHSITKTTSEWRCLSSLLEQRKEDLPAWY